MAGTAESGKPGARTAMLVGDAGGVRGWRASSGQGRSEEGGEAALAGFHKSRCSEAPAVGAEGGCWGASPG